MDATGNAQAVLVSLSRGAERSLLLVAQHPELVAGMVFIAPSLPLPPQAPRWGSERMFLEPRDSYDGWRKWNSNYWRDNYEEFLEWFFARVLTEPHSTKQREDSLGWVLERDAETLIATQLAPRLTDEAGVRVLTDRVRCPVLVIHGREDAVRPRVRTPCGRVTRARCSPS